MSSTTSIPLATPRSPGMARSQPTDGPPGPVDIGVVTLASRGCSLDATVAYGGVMVDDIEITLVNDTPSPAAFDVVVVEHGHWYRDLEIVVDYQQHLIQAGDGALDGRRTPLPLPRWARRVARVDVEPNSSGTADAVPIAGFLAVVCHRVFESRAITAPAGIVGPVELLVRGPTGETRTSIEAPTAAPDGRRPDTTSATMASSDASSVGTVTQAGGGACSIDPPVPTVTAAQFDITLVNEATIQPALFEVYRVETGYTRRDLAVIVDYQRELLRDLPAVYRPASPPPPPQWSVRVWSVTVPPGSSVTSPTLTANGTLVVVCHRSYDVGGIAYPESVVGPVAVLPPPSEAVLVAESFMDAWIVGDLPTALSYFGPRGTYDDDAVGVLVGLRRWYEAVGWEARHAGCAPLSEADPLPRARVACPYEFENDLTRLRPERSVGGLLLLTVDQSGILDAVDAYTADLLADAWYAFRHWLASTHPDDIDRMYVMTPQPFTPRLDAGAVPVWKTRMEEFAASGQPLSPSEGALTREEFGVVVRATCAEASVRHETTIIGLDPGSSLEVSVHESAARIAEEVLTELRALPVPDGAQDRIESVFDVMDEQLDVLEQLADAAAAGDAALIEELVRRRIDLTRRKDDLGGSDFRHCPISLPA